MCRAAVTGLKRIVGPAGATATVRVAGRVGTQNGGKPAEDALHVGRVIEVADGSGVEGQPLGGFLHHPERTSVALITTSTDSPVADVALRVCHPALE